MPKIFHSKIADMKRTHTHTPTLYRTSIGPVPVCTFNSCTSYHPNNYSNQSCSNQSCSNQSCNQSCNQPCNQPCNQSCNQPCNQSCNQPCNTNPRVINNRTCYTCQYAPYFCINYRRYAIWCDHCKITNTHNSSFLHTHPPCSDVYHNGMYVMPPPAHVVPCLVPPCIVPCSPHHTSSSCSTINNTDTPSVCPQVQSVCSVESFFNK